MHHLWEMQSATGDANPGDGNPGSGDGWRPRQAAHPAVITGPGFGGGIITPEGGGRQEQGQTWEFISRWYNRVVKSTKSRACV